MARTYHVEGITCDHCRAAIEAEVGRVPGLTSVKVDVTAKEVVIEGDPSDADVRQAIVEAGYEVT